MASKYFNVTVKPTIAASAQHAAFASSDVLFDWTEFEVPRGSSALIGATVLTRPKGDGGPTANRFPFRLIFSTTNTQSLGVANDPPLHRPSNDFIGQLEFEDKNFTGASTQGTAIATWGRGSGTGTQAVPIVLTGTEDGTNVGYDKLYIAAIAEGAMDFTSLNANTEDLDAEHANSRIITMDGTGMDVREHFIDGDVIHIGTSVGTPAADSLIGTVASADSATQITLDDVSATALVDGDIFYNIHPIRIILSFEK